MPPEIAQRMEDERRAKLIEQCFDCSDDDSSIDVQFVDEEYEEF